MAVQSRELHNRRMSINRPMSNAGAVAYLVTGTLVLLAVYVLVSSVVSAGRTFLDDLRYGRPRTAHLTANVGRAEEVNAPTHIVAMNLNRQVVILEIPGSDPNAVRALPGPYLVGAAEDLTPVTLRLDDVNGDAAPDLVVQIKREEIVYINRDGGFSLMTAEERQRLLQARGEGAR